MCTLSNSSICQTCANGFTYNSLSNICNPPQCPYGFVLSDTSLSGCGCSLFTYLSVNTCIQCPLNCVSCNSQGCIACSYEYYLAFNLSCLSCPANCILCTSTVCTQCLYGFSIQNGGCVSIGKQVSSLITSSQSAIAARLLLSNSLQVGSATSNNQYIQCGAGCSSCTNTVSNQLICTVAQPGYTLFAGVANKCSNSDCMTCLSGGVTCSSCFDRHTLIGGSCIACLDPNAISCLSSNFNYSTQCVPKYSASFSSTSPGGYCLPCAANCLKCDINGPANCDPSQCMLGFVQLTGTLNCTACLGLCPICDSNNLNLCLSCGPSRYNNGLGTCLSCSNGCHSCNSSSMCSACYSGYTLIGGNCFSNIDYPCATTNSELQCSQCFAYYVLSGSTCIIDLSCNLLNSCLGCPYGYYLLNSTCQTCPSLPNCLTCNQNSQCILCRQGYFLEGNSCSACNSNCKDCTSLSFCNLAADGYFVQSHIDNSNSGAVFACQSPCLACYYSANYCLSCISGYSISGSRCIADSKVIIKVNIGAADSNTSIFSDSDSDSIKLAKTIRNTNRIFNSICANIPDFMKVSNPNCINILTLISFVQGINSTIINAQINTTGLTNSTQL